MAHVPRLYWEDELAVGQSITISDERAHHLARVLKRRLGDELVLFRAPDQEYTGQIVELNRNNLTLELNAKRQVATESALRSVLVQGISRGDRMDYSVQKSVELGVYAIQPVLTSRSGVQLDDERMQRKQAHWQAIALSAAEQSGRTQVPQVRTCLTLDQYLQQRSAEQPGFVLCLEQHAHWGDAPTANQELDYLIGPEGGLDADEIAHAQRVGMRPLQLGPRVLRTETAGVAVLAALQARWGDL